MRGAELAATAAGGAVETPVTFTRDTLMLSAVAMARACVDRNEAVDTCASEMPCRPKTTVTDAALGGAGVGDAVVGAGVTGAVVGAEVGAVVGDVVGLVVVGPAVGAEVGAEVGAVVGLAVVGPAVGELVGAEVLVGEDALNAGL